MTRWPNNHFTADDLDAFHSASLSVEAQNHLAECTECRALVQQDRALVAALQALPGFDPAPGLADRVVARVRQPAALALPPSRSRRLALAAMVAVAIGASGVWSLFNRSLLLGWLDDGAAEVGRSLWVALRVAAANLAEQPWVASVGALVSSSGRAALLGGLLLAGYAAALIALRRLLASPSPAVSHVNG